MERVSLRQTIKEIMRKHLEENNGILLGECVSDPGGVAGTIPESKNVVDLPMTETAGADFAVGCAIVGRRPIFVTRFQDFMLMNGSPIIAFAAVYPQLVGTSAPVFVRALANDGFDATHSNVLHSMFMHFPGINVCAPITPSEYQSVWDVFMDSDIPMYVSEYRDTFDNTEELDDEIDPAAQINIFGVSVCRMHIREAKNLLKEKGIRINVVDILWLKPFNATKHGEVLKAVPLGLVVDPGHVICGAAESFAYQMMMACPGSRVETLGIEDKIKTTNPNCMNAVPSAQKIVDKVLDILGKQSVSY